MAQASLQTDQLFELLQSVGWKLQGTKLLAPHATIWLDVDEPWAGMNSGREFLARMRGRLERIRDNRSNLADQVQPWQDSLSDTLQLVECLEQVFGISDDMA